MAKHISKDKKVHLLTFCLQTSQGVFTRWAFLKQVLAIITKWYSLYVILTLHIFHLKLWNIEITKTLFLHDFDQGLLQSEMYKSNNKMYSTFTKVFKLVLDKHAPLKVKKVKGHQGPSMTKGLKKAIMNKSKIKNKYQKWLSRENFLALKEVKKFCN